MVVGGVARLSDGTAPVRRAAERRGFVVNGDRAAATEGSVPVSGVAIASLLAMQEAEGDAHQDREARQHGEALMDALGALQRALLGADGPDLAQLARLAERKATAADPGLAWVLQAVRVRAAVELARLERATSR